MNLAALLPHIDTAPGMMADADLRAEQAAELELARQQQEEATRAELTAEWEARSAEMVAAHQRALQVARQEWCDGEAVAIAANFAQQIDAASAALANAMHSILVPFATAALTKAALRDLCSKVQQAAAADLKAEIRLQGPADLVQALQAALAEVGMGSVAVGAGSTELQVRLGETRLLSHLPEWLSALKDSDHG